MTTATQRTAPADPSFERTLKWKEGIVVWLIRQLRPLPGTVQEVASEESTVVVYRDNDNEWAEFIITRDVGQIPARCHVSESGVHVDASNSMTMAVAMACKGWEL